VAPTPKPLRAQSNVRGLGPHGVDRDLEMVRAYHRAAELAPRGEDPIWVALVLAETFGYRLLPDDIRERLRRAS
jgi:hypothetical protein